ncbi:Acetamidase [Aspergillus sp. HF37]|nr:Acetamidase [Aspergillus sp. HF37]
MTTSWEQRAAEKRARLDKAIPAEWKIQSPPAQDSLFDYPDKCGILSPKELEITKSSASELVPKLATGALKSVDVTLAFCKRAALAQQLVNCSHEFFPEMALAQAKELDEYFEKHKKPVGPLHGMPISLKDQLRIKGVENCMAYVGWLGKYDTEESVLTTLLRNAGAVFYTKTSVPQTLMVCETVNNVIGRTLNPRNKNWSCGGSSGGEGAMVGIRGSTFGVGTDIGGSIRVPAAFNFLYGIRPSQGRMPYGKMANSMLGQETIESVVGPMAHCASDLRLFLTSVLEGEPWKYDPKVDPLPWRSNEEDAIKAKLQSGGLTLGFFNSDDNVLPHPPILRGMDIVTSTLKKNGHTLVQWKPRRHAWAVNTTNKIYAADGSTDVYARMAESGEPAIPNIQNLLNPSNPKTDLNELWDIQRQRWDYQMEYLAQWRDLEQQLGKELDAIVAPITPTAAIRHNQFKYYGYATVFNMLDLTSVTVPVTFADKALDKKMEGYRAMNEMDAAVQDEYDPEAYHGAPVAVQVIGRRLSEERTLAIAEEIGRLLGNSMTP